MSMTHPDDLKYTESHEWIRFEADGALAIGITHHAQEALGDIVFVELPELGKTLDAGEAAVVIESVKAASDVYVPLAGKVVAVNDALRDMPESVNRAPYEAWLIKLQPTDAMTADALLNAQAYGQLLSE